MKMKLAVGAFAVVTISLSLLAPLRLSADESGGHELATWGVIKAQYGGVGPIAAPLLPDPGGDVIVGQYIVFPEPFPVVYTTIGDLSDESAKRAMMIVGLSDLARHAAVFAVAPTVEGYPNDVFVLACDSGSAELYRVELTARAVVGHGAVTSTGFGFCSATNLLTQETLDSEVIMAMQKWPNFCEAFMSGTGIVICTAIAAAGVAPGVICTVVWTVLGWASC